MGNRAILHSIIHTHTRQDNTRQCSVQRYSYVLNIVSVTIFFSTDMEIMECSLSLKLS